VKDEIGLLDGDDFKPDDGTYPTLRSEVERVAATLPREVDLERVMVSKPDDKGLVRVFVPYKPSRAADMPEGFEECSQCRCWHRPVSGVCVYKLDKNADFVLDASGAVLSLQMIERVLRELDIKESYRYVSAPQQQFAYMLATGVIRPDFKTAEDGAEWVTRVDYPADVLLIETEGGFGLVKALAVEGLPER
jgi:hypothetical protein